MRDDDECRDGPDRSIRARFRRRVGRRVAMRVPNRLRGRSRLSAQGRLRNLAAIFESADDAMMITDLRGIVSAWNSAAGELYGYGAEEMVGRSVTVLVPPGRRDETFSILARVGRGERTEQFETVRMRKDGTRVEVSLRVSPVRDAAGRISGASAIIRDVTATRRAREELDRAHQELSSYAARLEQRNRDLLLVSQISEMLHSVESEGEIHGIVDEYGPRLLPGLAGRLYLLRPSGNHVELVASWAGGGPSPTFPTRDCWALCRGRVCGRPRPDNAPRCPHVGGSPGPYACIPLIARGQAIGVLHLVAARPDDACLLDEADELLAVTLMESVALSLTNFRLREMLQLQSLRDPGTGLFNRRYLEDAFGRELTRAARDNEPLGLMMLDLDHFKAFNDTHGHDAADALLRELARLLERNIRGADIACRYGGDE
ncbi:MAG TPA: diguanylate cyclase, partial [Acidimicrobiia bacterium]